MGKNVIHRINAVLIGLAGLFSLFLVFAIGRLVAGPDELAADETALVPYLMAFCIFYGLICIIYAYCRFFSGRENNSFLRFVFKWPIYIFALFVHGLSLLWAIPLLFGLSDLRLPFAMPLGVIALANIVADAAPYLKAAAIWVKDALFPKKKK